MLSPVNLLLLTALFCIMMLLVLGSLVRSAIPGVKEWTAANAMAFIALLLYALRGKAPDLFSIVIANSLFAASVTVIYIGFRRFFARGLPTITLSVSFALMLLAVAAFRYLIDSIALRTVTVSIYHGVICFCIGKTVGQSKPFSKAHYSSRFTALMAFLLAFGHGVRALIYGMNVDVLTSVLQASAWNLFFLSIGTLVLPIFTMGAVMMVHDRMMAKALNDANHDFLTGAWSRRAFFEFAEHELRRVQRSGRPLSILIFDVDHFKQINDNYGHATGDQVLKDLVQSASKEIRQIDKMARMGGEEFAVLLTETDQAPALMVGERLRNALRRHVQHQAAVHKKWFPIPLAWVLPL